MSDESSRPRKMGYSQRYQLWKDKRAQRKHPTDLAALPKTDLDRVDPMDFFLSGAPRYPKLLAPAMIAIGVVVGIEVVKERFMLDPLTLNQLSAIQPYAAVLGALAVISVVILLQTGTFSHIWAQIEPLIERQYSAVLTEPDQGRESVTAIRLTGPPECLWWPGREKTVKTEMQQKFQQREKREKDDKDTYPDAQETAKRKVASFSKKDDKDKDGKDDEKKEGKDDKGNEGRAEIHLPPMPSGRLSDVDDVIAMMNAYMRAEPVPEVPRKNDVRRAREELIALCETVQLPYYVNMLPLTGRRRIVVISQYRLVSENPVVRREGATSGQDIVELEGHPRVQRTFSYQAKNPHAMWASFTKITSYVNYTIPPKWRRFLPGWSAEVNLFPIYFITASAGRCRAVERGLSENIEALDIQRVQMIEDTYQIGLVPQLIDDLKVAVEQLDRKDRSWQKLLDELNFDEKQRVMWLLQNLSRMPNAGKVGLGSRLGTLLTKSAWKYLFYIVVIVAVAFLLATLFPQFFGAVPTTPGTTVGGG